MTYEMHRIVRISVVGFTVALLVTGLFSFGALSSNDPPDQYTADEPTDSDGSGSTDFMIGSPSGGTGGSTPGTVTITTVDGQTVVTFQGTTPGDDFGYSIAVIKAFAPGGYDAVFVGAPQDQGGEGLVYVFYGPFGGTQSYTISAADADLVLAGSTPGLIGFGSMVGEVSDLTADGVPEVRVLG